jgi:hypothetical protein
MGTRGRVRSPELNRNNHDQFVGLRSKTSLNTSDGERTEVRGENSANFKEIIAKQH